MGREGGTTAFALTSLKSRSDVATMRKKTPTMTQLIASEATAGCCSRYVWDAILLSINHAMTSSRGLLTG
jgi:hypothetical protein